MSSLIALFLVTVASSQPSSWSDWESEFDYVTFLDEDDQYKLYWSNVNYDNTIEFGIMVNTTGWIALGISPDGKMPGSDIFLGWVSDSGQAFLEDRFARGQLKTHKGVSVFSEYAQPTQDNTDDLTLISGEELDGWTRINFSRDKYICDSDEDLSIKEGTTRIIYAFNKNTDNFVKHSAGNKGSQSLNLDSKAKGADVDLDFDSLNYIDIKMDNFTIPAEETMTFYCLPFKFPEFVSTQHVVHVDPIITPGNEAIVHAVALWECASSAVNVTRHIGEVDDHCFGADSTNTACFLNGMKAGWAMGARGYSLPANVGLEIGGSPITDDIFQYGIMHIHYENPKLYEDIVDSSGIRLWYTDEIRENSMGIMVVGLPVPLADAPWDDHFIPPGMNYTVNYAYCPADCTRAGFPEDGVTIFASLAYAHTSATAMRLRHIRNGVELEPIVTDWNYDAYYGQPQHYDQEIKVLPGDELIMECYYDTTDRDDFTWGGLRIEQEVCLVYLSVYPEPDVYGCFTTHVSEDVSKWFNVSKSKDYVVNNYRNEYSYVANGERGNEQCAQRWYNELWTDQDFENRYHICSKRDGTFFYDIGLYETITDFNVYEHPKIYYGCNEEFKTEGLANGTQWDLYCDESESDSDSGLKQGNTWKTIGIVCLVLTIFLSLVLAFVCYSYRKDMLSGGYVSREIETGYVPRGSAGGMDMETIDVENEDQMNALKSDD